MSLDHGQKAFKLSSQEAATMSELCLYMHRLSLTKHLQSADNYWRNYSLKKASQVFSNAESGAARPLWPLPEAELQLYSRNSWCSTKTVLDTTSFLI